MQRTNYCGLIDDTYIGQTITIKGWVHKRRDLGGLVFFDLRDREGLIQCIAEPESSCFKDAEQIKHEYVLTVTGIVRKRPHANPELKTGTIEVVATNIEILNISNSGSLGARLWQLSDVNDSLSGSITDGYMLSYSTGSNSWVTTAGATARGSIRLYMATNRSNASAFYFNANTRTAGSCDDAL